MTTRLSLFAVVFALGGCCLEVVSETGSGPGASAETSSTGPTCGSGGLTSAGGTSGGASGCAVPARGPIAVTTLAGNGVAGFFDGSGGRAGSTEFHTPWNVAVDAIGNVYVADIGNARIRKVAPDGSTITVAGNGTPGNQDGTGGPNGTAEFAFPEALALDSTGNILVVDDDYSTPSIIRRVEPSGNVTTRPVMGLDFSDALGIAITEAGNILLADSGNHRVAVINSSGNATILASDASLDPTGLAVGPDGSVYFADFSGNVIRKIDMAGNVTTVAGNDSIGFGFADGPASDAQFDGPIALAVDPQGNVVVADWNNDRIRRIDVTGYVTTLAGNGQGSGEADGTGGANGTAEFAGPRGVSIDAACNLYVADDGNNRIRKITFGTPPP